MSTVNMVAPYFVAILLFKCAFLHAASAGEKVAVYNDARSYTFVECKRADLESLIRATYDRFDEKIPNQGTYVAMLVSFSGSLCEEELFLKEVEQITIAAPENASSHRYLSYDREKEEVKVLSSEIIERNEELSSLVYELLPEKRCDVFINGVGCSGFSCVPVSREVVVRVVRGLDREIARTGFSLSQEGKVKWYAYLLAQHASQLGPDEKTVDKTMAGYFRGVFGGKSKEGDLTKACEWGSSSNYMLHSCSKDYLGAIREAINDEYSVFLVMKYFVLLPGIFRSPVDSEKIVKSFTSKE